MLEEPRQQQQGPQRASMSQIAHAPQLDAAAYLLNAELPDALVLRRGGDPDAVVLEPPCQGGCGRPRSRNWNGWWFTHCCRTCEWTDGRQHGPWCEQSEAARRSSAGASSGGRRNGPPGGQRQRSGEATHEGDRPGRERKALGQAGREEDPRESGFVCVGCQPTQLTPYIEDATFGKGKGKDGRQEQEEARPSGD